jgi:putative spermidine/putrescine transport system permease protein
MTQRSLGSAESVRTARRRAKVRGMAPWLGTVPFAVFVGLFLLLPTAIVVIGAFRTDNGLTLENLRLLKSPSVRDAFVNSVVVSAASSAIGAIVGGLLAYAVSTAAPTSALRRAVTSVCGVLGLFGGVSLAFAFIATLGGAGVATQWLLDLGININANGIWIYDLSGLVLVYSYFQIPLMVLLFLPALDEMHSEWREAAENLGSSTWDYWRTVGLPLLWPAFASSFLLLFTNAFSAFATVAALISQGGILVPLQISHAVSSEVGGSSSGQASALAMAMIFVVLVVVTTSRLLQRLTVKWTE